MKTGFCKKLKRSLFSFAFSFNFGRAFVSRLKLAYFISFFGWTMSFDDVLIGSEARSWLKTVQNWSKTTVWQFLRFWPIFVHSRPVFVWFWTKFSTSFSLELLDIYLAMQIARSLAPNNQVLALNHPISSTFPTFRILLRVLKSNLAYFWSKANSNYCLFSNTILAIGLRLGSSFGSIFAEIWLLFAGQSLIFWIFILHQCVWYYGHCFWLYYCLPNLTYPYLIHFYFLNNDWNWMCEDFI